MAISTAPVTVAALRVTRFEVVREKRYHLFVISQDMQHFQHIHPDMRVPRCERDCRRSRHDRPAVRRRSCNARDLGSGYRGRYPGPPEGGPYDCFGSGPPEGGPYDCFASGRLKAAPTTTSSIFRQPAARGRVRLAADTYVWALQPRIAPGLMSIQVSARRPDGRVEILLFARDIPAEWPTPYLLDRPVLLPRGTEVTVSTHYANNPPADRTLLILSRYRG